MSKPMRTLLKHLPLLGLAATLAGCGPAIDSPTQEGNPGTSSQALSSVVKLAAGTTHSMAIVSGNTLWAWGDNYYHQLGDGTSVKKTSPVSVTVLGVGATDVSVSGGHTLVVEAGDILGWGDNSYGQLGNGSNQISTPVELLTGASAVSTSGGHTLGLKAGGTVWAWGANGQGRLGDGTTLNRYTPVQVLASAGVGLTGVTAISAGGTHSLALKSDGTVWAWGDNYNRQLGDGTTTNRSYPVQVLASAGEALTGVTAISAGGSFSLALKSDGTVVAWGYNGNGQLGDGTSLPRTYPVQVHASAGVALTGVTAIDAGGGHSLALKSDGTVVAWGYNYYGQVGNNAVLDQKYAVAVLDNASAVSAGGNHSLAVKSDSVWGWGMNGSGQLGIGNTTNSKIPVQQ